MLQQSFSLNSASSSLASSFASRGANQQQSSPLVYVAIIFAIIIVGTALFNKYKAKKSWKKIAKVLAVGVVIPIVVLLLVPSVFISMVLASAFLVGAALFVFLGQRK